MKLQQIFFNEKITKTASMIFLTSVAFILIFGTLEVFMKIETPSPVVWITGTPFMVFMFGALLLGGPIMRVMKDDLTQDKGGERCLVGVSGFLNSVVGLIIINKLVLEPLQLGSMAQFELPFLTIPFYFIMAIFVGNVVYSKAIVEPLLKRGSFPVMVFCLLLFSALYLILDVKVFG